MIPSATLQQLIERGVAPEAHEAVAIILGLLETCRSGVDPEPPAGPPTLESVRVAMDGSVLCPGCAVTPAVSELGILLEAMLPRASTRAPGGLRYTIARSLLEVDAPPFDSATELAATLQRYERGDRGELLRALYARYTAAAGARAVVTPFVDRRRNSTRSDDLRRRLREADRELYERILAAEPLTSVTVTVAPLDEVPLRERPTEETVVVGIPLTFPEPSETDRVSPLRWASAIAIAASLSFAAGHAFVTWSQWSHPLATNAPHTVDRALLPSSSLGQRPSARTAVDPNVRPLARTPSAARTPSRSQPPATEVALTPAVDRSTNAALSPAFASNGTVFFDGDRVAAAAGPSGDLRVMSIGDDGSRNYHVQPSPDDTRVAFDSDRDGERGVYVANRDGSGVRRVSGDGYAAMPTWSPDGSRLAFVRAEVDRPHVWNLWLLTLANGETRRLTSFMAGQTWGASWFADGRRVAYTHEDRLAVLDVASGATELFPSPLAGRPVRAPAVSPDGRHVIFQVERSGAWLLDLQDGFMRCVLTDPTADAFAWSPDGRRVAFHSRRDGQWGVWLMASAS